MNSKRKLGSICISLTMVCLLLVGSIIFIKKEHKTNDNSQEDTNVEEQSEPKVAVNENQNDSISENQNYSLNENDSESQYSQDVVEKQYITSKYVYESESNFYYRIGLGDYDVDITLYYYSGYDLCIAYDDHSHHTDFQVLNSDMVEIPVNSGEEYDSSRIYHFTCYNEECVLRMISEDGTDVEDVWIKASVDPIYLEAENVLGYTEWTYEIHEGPLMESGNSVDIYSVPDHVFLGGIDYASNELFKPEEMELYVVDIDDDGVTELICNLQYTTGGRCVQIYKSGYKVGLVDWNYYERSLGVDWLMQSAIQEYYDPERKLIIGYLSNALWESYDPDENLLSSDARFEYAEGGINFLVEIDDPELIIYY